MTDERERGRIRETPGFRQYTTAERLLLLESFMREFQKQRVLEKVAGLEDRTAGQRKRLEAAERGYGEVKGEIGGIKNRWRERDEKYKELENKVKEAAALAAHVHDIYRKAIWCFGGGTAVVGALVALWTFIVQPLLALLPKP